MGKTIKVIDNQTIELISYRNPNICFSIEDTTYIKDEGISGELKTNKFQDCEYFCDFREQINPFELYSKNKEQEEEIARLNKIIDDLREYMLDIDYKMGWQYAEYLDELLGIKSNYKKYGIAIDLKEEGKNE